MNDRAQSILGRSPVTRWFDTRYAPPTAAQEAAWPPLAAGHHTLIVSPTGTGKTLAAFLSVLHAMAGVDPAPTPGIRCLYLSPLRALGYDLEKNLQGPLREIYPSAPPSESPIRVGLRNGDTPVVERERRVRFDGVRDVVAKSRRSGEHRAVRTLSTVAKRDAILRRT